MTFATAPKAAVKALEGAAKTSAKGKALTGFYRLASTPAAPHLWAYMVAIFTMALGYTDSRNPMQVALIKAFFGGSGTAIRWHTTKGNLEPAGVGTVRLTVAGLSYFRGRFTGQTKGQSITQEQVDEILAGMKSGKYPAVLGPSIEI
jgi:hypothetical protein